MSLYYEDEFVRLYHGNCLEELAWLEADVLINDPPYGIDYQSGFRRDQLKASILNDKDTSVRDGVLSLWGDKPALILSPPPLRQSEAPRSGH